MLVLIYPMQLVDMVWLAGGLLEVGINRSIASSTDDILDRRARDGSWVCSTKTMLMGGQVGMAGWFLT